MRVLGAVLLVGGVLLCVSIVWAALGFVMMGVALICLLVAEERSKRARLAIELGRASESRLICAAGPIRPALSATAS